MTAASGPFFFAWTDEPPTGGIAFGPEHQVEDEQIVSFRIDHAEGQIPTLNIDIRNPRRGLLSGQIWAWLSYDTGTAGVMPLFFGRLVGIPTNILQEVVTLQLVAKPIDFLSQKQALAETLKVRPYWDPVFIDPDKRDDVETIMEGYSAFWHVDRTTLDVTISDVISGEDGLLNFTADEISYDSVQLTVGAPPLTAINVTGTVHWTQTAVGTVDFGTRTIAGGASIVNSWPKPGAQLAGGWSVASSTGVTGIDVTALRTTAMQYNYENKQKTHANGDTMSLHVRWTRMPPVAGELIYSNFESQAGIIPSEDNETPSTPLHMSYNMVLVANNEPFQGTLALQYDAKDNRQETVKFSLLADLQPIVTLPDPADVEESIEINGTDVGIGLDPNDPTGSEVPIVDTSRNGYFPSERGLWSLEYLISVARAHILAKARAVSISWDCSFARALDLSCRKNASIQDDRISGGGATGKITAYSLVCDGDAGSLFGNVTIQCAIGHDGTVSASAGTPSYVNTGYVNTGYQVYTGQTAAPFADVSYSIPVLEPGGLVYPLTKDQVFVSETITYEDALVNVGTERVHQLPTFDGIQVADDTIQIFKSYPVPSWALEVKSVTGNNFAAEYTVDTSVLKIPKLIDLEAGSA